MRAVDRDRSLRSRARGFSYFLGDIAFGLFATRIVDIQAKELTLLVRNAGGSRDCSLVLVETPSIVRDAQH